MVLKNESGKTTEQLLAPPPTPLPKPSETENAHYLSTGAALGTANRYTCLLYKTSASYTV